MTMLMLRSIFFFTFIFFYYSFQISQAANACNNNISKPFLTTAPLSAPFFMKRVVSGLYNKSYNKWLGVKY